MRDSKQGITAIVLAGGLSSRMGEDKGKMPWGETSLLEQVLKRLKPIAEECIVATKEIESWKHLPAKLVLDESPDACPLFGLYAGLKAASYERCFVCACDMPLINTVLVRFLLDALEDRDCVLPKTPDGLQPLHAVYQRRVVKQIQRQIETGELSLHAFAEKLDTRIIPFKEFQALDPDGHSFLNINTESDYRRAIKLYSNELQ